MPGGGGLVAAGIPANSFVRIGVHGSARVCPGLGRSCAVRAPGVRGTVSARFPRHLPCGTLPGSSAFVYTH